MQSLKKLFSFRGLFALVLVAISIHLIFPEAVFAQGVGGSEKSVLGSLSELLGVLISVLTFVSLLMMKFFGQLLGTDLLTGPEAMQALTPMWVWVRNLTNILFVIVLVGLAFSNLFASFSGENGGNWTIKEKLPKVIIALVAINFSLLGFKVVIDAVNVGTVAILGIADSRLDADNPDQKSAMVNSKTWTVVTKPTYDKFNGRIEAPADVDKVKGGESCTAEYNNKFPEGNPDKKVLGISKLVSEKTVHYICRDFRSQVNDLFCSGWDSERKDYDKEGTTSDDLNDDCLFILKKDSFETMLNPDDEPGQNLFMSFGTTFMHLEKLPALGAKIDSLNGLIMNTLFSSILSIAYIVALVAIFIALLSRVIVIWIALVFSPLLIAASIMGFGDGKAGEVTGKLITNLIMPLKIAAAFAVSFVMMSGMIEFNVVQQGDGFLFGPALSNLGIDGYGFMWQMATIVIFWKAASWATEGSFAESITEKIFTGAETLGGMAARAATIDRQFMSVKTRSGEQSVTLGNLISAATMAPGAYEHKMQKQNAKFQELLWGENKAKTAITNADFKDHKSIDNIMENSKNRVEFDSYTNDILNSAKNGGAFGRALYTFSQVEKNKGKKISELLEEFGRTSEGMENASKYSKPGYFNDSSKYGTAASSTDKTKEEIAKEKIKADAEKKTGITINSKDSDGKIKVDINTEVDGKIKTETKVLSSGDNTSAIDDIIASGKVIEQQTLNDLAENLISVKGKYGEADTKEKIINAITKKAVELKKAGNYSYYDKAAGKIHLGRSNGAPLILDISKAGNQVGDTFELNELNKQVRALRSEFSDKQLGEYIKKQLLNIKTHDESELGEVQWDSENFYFYN